MSALVQQTFLEKNPCKKSADLHPRQGNLIQRNIFTGLSKTSLHFTKLVVDQLKKFTFFNMCLIHSTKTSMGAILFWNIHSWTFIFRYIHTCKCYEFS
jgi:hypothetical protein